MTNPKYLIIIGADKIPFPIKYIIVYIPAKFDINFPSFFGSIYKPSLSSGSSLYFVKYD